MFHKIDLLTHYGNTANNAYYNMRTLAQAKDFSGRQRIVEFGLKHAISAPAWEELEFEVPSSEWIANPQWSDFPDSETFNSVREPWVHSRGSGRLASIVARLRQSKFPFERIYGFVFSGIATRLRRSIIESLPAGARERLVQLTKVLIMPIWLLRLKPLEGDATSRKMAIIYGANFLGSARIPRRRSFKLIAFEHGTFRWSMSKSSGIFETAWKSIYRRNIRRCDFALVSNLDSETIDAASRLMGNRWAAVPHPYISQSCSPYSGNNKNRAELQMSTDSDHLILLGSSHNWSSLHDKGTMLALEAFRDLRARGHRVGLVTIEWGLQTDESRNFLAENQLDQYVHWYRPLPRKSLQKLAADCDLSWNQFAYRAIGAFDLRMLEQGVPHVSMAPDEVGASLIGAHAPWYDAVEASGIVTQTERILSQYNHRPRKEILDEHAELYRAWLSRYHSPEVLLQIQAIVFERLSVGHSWEDGKARATWAQVTAKLGD